MSTEPSIGQPGVGTAMRHGVILPGGTAPQQLELAQLAEEAGWDGVFVWEATYGVDAWALLAAMAVRTQRVRLGTVLSPLPWRRPWKLASQAATVDQLSGGRAVLTVGLGALEMLFGTGEPADRAERAKRLDEGIDLMRTLWSGGREYHGRYYDFAEDRDGAIVDVGRPVQETVPIWVVGAWPHPRSMRRAARCEGVVPEYCLDGRDPEPRDVRELRSWLARNGARPDIDVIAQGETSAGEPESAGETVAERAAAGCTWWLETRWQAPDDPSVRLDEMRERITAGPPRSPAGRWPA
jgi:alkanesulfonate monooxygenase SsuD/methylene tetrahydromethanopterin reductase-like flavin-dependent oxidoreductase (luciferase family)